MAKTTEQPRNLNEAEIELIQKTFKGNEALLKAIRSLFFGLGITDGEAAEIRATFTNPDLKAIMWRRFCPMMDKASSIGQVQDVWLGAEEMVFGQNPDTIYQAVKYKQISIDMIKQALKALEAPEMPLPYSLDYAPGYGDNNKPDTELQTALLGRNQFIKHVEQQLLFLWMIAGQEPKPKPTGGAKEVINKDSNK